MHMLQVLATRHGLRHLPAPAATTPCAACETATRHSGSRACQPSRQTPPGWRQQHSSRCCGGSGLAALAPGCEIAARNSWLTSHCTSRCCCRYCFELLLRRRPLLLCHGAAQTAEGEKHRGLTQTLLTLQTGSGHRRMLQSRALAALPGLLHHQQNKCCRHHQQLFAALELQCCWSSCLLLPLLRAPTMSGH